MPNIPRLVISATRGGTGKTTLSLAITAAWKRQKKRIAIFKKGPDFIDAGWLGAVAGRSCYNLDLFMMQPDAILRSFWTHSRDADAALIEGNRGLYDGVDEAGSYSTAKLARLLKTPVVLIVDCTKASGTVGAVVLGCRNYDTEVNIPGVILNNVSSGRHESVVRKAVEENAGIPVVGAVPRQRKGRFPERHMGLVPFQEHAAVTQAVSEAVSAAEQYIDLDALWKIACRAPDMNIPATAVEIPGRLRETDSPVIGVIRDTAFQFYYPDNLEALEQAGARLEVVNAVKDKRLPALDALYIGGGFPETQAAALAENESFCQSVKAAAEQGMPIYGECGGLIYLGRSLQVENKIYPMTGVFPADFVLEKKPQAHGYTVVKAGQRSTFLRKGVLIRGHEFHYSRIVNLDGLPPLAYDMERGTGVNGSGDGLVYRNVIGAYTHLHALGTPEWAESMIEKACEYRRNKIHQE